MRTPILFLLCLTFSILSVTGQDLENAVRKMYHDYPEMRLQDFYKSFYQDRFGPGHMITDSVAVYQYLQQELQTPDNPKVLYEPTGTKGRFYRIHLACVQRGYITAEELNRAFVHSANLVNGEELTDWKTEWKQITSAIESSGLGIDNYRADKRKIKRMLARSGDVAIHHSIAFNEAYQPHYRIVQKDIFEKELLPQIMRKSAPGFKTKPPIKKPVPIKKTIEDRYSPNTLIIMVDTVVGKEPLKLAIKAYGAELKYDYNIIPGVAIIKPADKTIEETMEYFRKVEGVISVERDEIKELH